ncbi:hypothetical protein GQ53DRAFT_719602 [Thozetella sp. PMI_491]|nr:hypothetical protein GQ53DRAFT_719602 [Thozetella sp. PMI_491]
MAPTIFVFGSVNGQLEAAFKKLSLLHAKNSFSFAIVTGNLFAEEQEQASLEALLSGQITIACPTYFTVGTTPLPAGVVEKIGNDEEIAPNLHYLGKRTVFKTSDGVRIVTLGGMLDATIVGGQSMEQHLPYHTNDDAKALKGANTADILLTVAWPRGVWRKSSKEISVDPATIPATDAIAELCASLKPRYHFAMSPGDFCFEREPFFPPESKDGGDNGITLTRFISMAPWGNAAKAKSMYAFVLNKEAVVTPPAGSTISPFLLAERKKRTVDDADFSRFSNGHGHDGDRRHKQRRRRDRSPPPGPDRCFFCMGNNPDLPEHMVVVFGDDCYLATAKGPLPAPDTFKDRGLNFPGHMIITTLQHTPTLSKHAAGMDEEQVAKTFTEMSRLRDSMQGMVSKLSKSKLGAVTWEISRSRNIHLHWQFMPVPAALVKAGTVEAGFRVLAQDLGLGTMRAKEFGAADEIESDYFRVWIWAEDPDDEAGQVLRKSLVLQFDDSIRFDLQYPRKVMAKLMDLEKRTVWQDVAQTVEEETENVAAFREAFKEWDFTGCLQPNDE